MAINSFYAEIRIMFHKHPYTNIHTHFCGLWSTIVQVIFLQLSSSSRISRIFALPIPIRNVKIVHLKSQERIRRTLSYSSRKLRQFWMTWSNVCLAKLISGTALITLSIKQAFHVRVHQVDVCPKYTASTRF